MAVVEQTALTSAFDSTGDISATVRDDEIAAATSLLSKHKGSSILITGEEGTGKSMFTEKFMEMLEQGRMKDADAAVQLMQNVQVVLTGNLKDAGTSIEESLRNAAKAAFTPALQNRFKTILLAPMSEETQRMVAGHIIERQIREKGMTGEDFTDAHGFVMGKVAGAFNAHEGGRGIRNTVQQVVASQAFKEFIAHGTPLGRQRRGKEVAEIVSKGVVTNTEAPARASFRRRTMTA